MNTYPTYKPSHIDWIGDIPAHWEVKKLKSEVSLNDDVLPETTEDDFEIEYVEISGVQSQSGVVKTEIVKFKEAPSRARRLVKHGDVIVSTVRTYLRAIAKIENPPTNMVVSTGFAVIRPISVDTGFSGYLFNSDYFVNEVIARSTGVSYPAINAPELVNIKVALPPLAEQVAIATYLDEQTAQLDGLIARKRRLMALLREEKAALINEAVTKGIRPNVPTKPSGIDWLGDVPAHWEVKKLKYVVEAIIDTEHKTVHFVEGGEYPVVRTSDVRFGQLFLSGIRRTDETGYEEWTKRGAPESGDVLFTREAPAGEACVVPDRVKVCLGQRMVLFKLRKDRIYSVFMVASIYSILVREYINTLSQGSTVAHFNMSDIKEIPLFLPPLAEQAEIVTYLDAETAKIDFTVGRIEREIELMQEYRTALISEVVTGKVKVVE